MADVALGSSAAPDRAVGHDPDGAPTTAFDWPRFPALERAAATLPLLQMPPAQTIARDRWERLVTRINIPAAPDEVWRALTDPDALRLWLAVCHGSLEQTQRDCVLDFEDGEFFLCRPVVARAPERLQYLWRWLGVGQATAVTWQLEGVAGDTRVTVTEEAVNPPWDWQTWNGGGWPGILEQLAAYLRTGTTWRWPWRRMGPYAQVELAAPAFDAWDRLFSPAALRFWLQVMRGSVAPGQQLTVMMGDASGTLEMSVQDIVEPGQAPPSFLPSLTFTLARPAWHSEVGGRFWLEPAGWGRSVFQVFNFNWDRLPAGLQLSERKIVAAFWAGAMRRAALLCGGPPPAAPGGANGAPAGAQAGPHSW